MSTERTPVKTKTPGRAVVATGIAATVLIAAGAFILSFAALTDLAAMSGISPALAWIWPVIVDGLIVASTVSIVALAGHERRVLAYPWFLLFFGAAVSTAANAVHAILATGSSGVPPVVSALIASMPPVVLLAVTHLSVILVQKAGIKPKPKKVAVPVKPAAKAKAEPKPKVDAAQKPAEPFRKPDPKKLLHSPELAGKPQPGPVRELFPQPALDLKLDPVEENAPASASVPA